MVDEQTPKGRGSVRAEIISLATRMREAAEGEQPIRYQPVRNEKIAKIKPLTPAQKAAAETIEATEDLTAKEELFCQEIAKGTSKYEAAGAAGYKGAMKSLSVVASRKLGMHKIKMRIAALQNINLLNVRITRDIHMRQLAELRERANFLGQIGPAIRAEELRGKLAGLYRDDEDQKLVIGERVAKLPVEEQLSMVRAALQRIQTLTGAHIQMRIERAQKTDEETTIFAPVAPTEPDAVPPAQLHDYDGIDDEPVGLKLRRKPDETD